MKRPSVAFVALVGLIACAAPDFRGAAAETPEKPSDDAVVARVGDTVYTLADFQKRFERLDAPYRYATERRLPEYVREVVRREALAREARRLGLDGDPPLPGEKGEATPAILIRALYKRGGTGRPRPTPEDVKSVVE